MKFHKIKFDIRLWYIGHIVGLVGIAFIGGHYLQDFICTTSKFCIEQLPTSKMLLYNLIYYSGLAYLYDTIFHSVTGLD
ncbi:MAG: hypothetical protein WC758_07815 [Candidatus Woesearchaeota archaeon]|jgi:hypothetical protein